MMKLEDLIKKLETIGLYPDNEDLMYLDYEGGHGVIIFTDENGVDYRFKITDNQFDMNAAGHNIAISYQRQIVIDKSPFISFECESGESIQINANIIFLTEDDMMAKLQKAHDSFANLQFK